MSTLLRITGSVDEIFNLRFHLDELALDKYFMKTNKQEENPMTVQLSDQPHVGYKK